MIKIPNEIKTLLWTLFYQGVAFVAAEGATQVSTLHLDPFYITLIGLVLATISKAAAKKLAK